MNDREVPTNPESSPPPSFTEEDQATKFARLAGHMLAPIKTDMADMRQAAVSMPRLAQQIFDEFCALRHRVEQRMDTVERRVSALELRLSARED